MRRAVEWLPASFRTLSRTAFRAMESKFSNLFDRARTDQPLPGDIRGGVHRDLLEQGKVCLLYTSDAADE